MKSHKVEKQISFRIRISYMLVSILTIFMFLMTVSKGSAQSIQTAVMMNKTVAGIHGGLEIGAVFKSQLGLFIFHDGLTLNAEERKSSFNYSMYGLSFQAPIKRCEDIQLVFKLSAGLVNNSFLIAYPQLQTQIRLYKQVCLGIDMGYRMSHITGGTSLMFRI